MATSIEVLQFRHDVSYDPAEPYSYEGVEIDPVEVFDRYAESEHGQFHSNQSPRYSQRTAYNYFPHSQFLDDLGDDVHPVRHMLHTHHNIAVPLIEVQNRYSRTQDFSNQAAAELRTTALLHDLGECMHPSIVENLGYALGDVQYGTAAPDHKDKELAIRDHLLKLYYPDLPGKLLDRVNEIDFNSGKQADFLSCAFEVVERLGYFMTSRRAAEIVIKEQKSYEPGDHRIAQLGRLATIVGNNHYAFLRSQQRKFPYVKSVLDSLTQHVVV